MVLLKWPEVEMSVVLETLELWRLGDNSTLQAELEDKFRIMCATSASSYEKFLSEGDRCSRTQLYDAIAAVGLLA